MKLYRVHFTTAKILITSSISVVSSTLRQRQTSYHIKVKLHLVHFDTDNFLSHHSVTSTLTNFLLHKSEVVSSTPCHWQTSYHTMVKLYRLHFTTDKILITSQWSYNEYISPRTKFLSHHSEVISSTLHQGQNSYHNIVNLYRVRIARVKLRHRQTFYHIKVNLHRVYFFGLFRTGSEHSIFPRSMKWFRTFWTNNMVDKLTVLFL